MAILFILIVLAYVKLLFLRAVTVPRATLSAFELKRRLAADDEVAKQEQRREDTFSLQKSLFDLTFVVFTVGFVALFIATFGWLYGVVFALLLVVVLNPLSRVSFIQQFAQKIFRVQEERLQAVVSYKYLRPVLAFLRGQDEVVNEKKLGSREELEDLITKSSVVSDQEQKLLFRALAFPSRIVHEIFTVRKKVTTVDKKEVLGPKLLDELHQSGQGAFPVVDGGFDKIVGILPAHDIMNTQRQGKLTAEKAMREEVVYVPEGDSLESTLRTLLRERQYYGIVVNNLKENIGVISIDNIINELLGPARKRG